MEPRSGGPREGTGDGQGGTRAAEGRGTRNRAVPGAGAVRPCRGPRSDHHPRAPCLSIASRSRRGGRGTHRPAPTCRPWEKGRSFPLTVAPRGGSSSRGVGEAGGQGRESRAREGQLLLRVAPGGLRASGDGVIATCSGYGGGKRGLSLESLGMLGSFSCTQEVKFPKGELPACAGSCPVSGPRNGNFSRASDEDNLGHTVNRAALGRPFYASIESKKV